MLAAGSFARLRAVGTRSGSGRAGGRAGGRAERRASPKRPIRERHNVATTRIRANLLEPAREEVPAREERRDEATCLYRSSVAVPIGWATIAEVRALSGLCLRTCYASLFSLFLI